MIKLTTADNEYVWVNQERIVLITQAKSANSGGPPVPVLGVSLVVLVGAPAPLVIKGSPEELAVKLEKGNGGSLFTA